MGCGLLLSELLVCSCASLATEGQSCQGACGCVHARHLAAWRDARLVPGWWGERVEAEKLEILLATLVSGVGKLPARDLNSFGGDWKRW